MTHAAATGLSTPDQPGDLPAADGRIAYRGWAPAGHARFNAAPCAGDRRLRQWDFFTAMNGEFALNVTLADIHVATLCTVDAIEWSTGRSWQATALSVGGRQPIAFGATPQEGAVAALGRSRVAWHPRRGEHAAEVTIDMPPGLFSAGARGRLLLTRPDGAPYLAHVMPLDDQGAFFYQNKIPGYAVEGEVVIGDRTLRCTAGTCAIRDWGRGLWPHRLRWLWGAGHGATADGRTVWANFGGGFGDTTAASENLLVIDGQAVKLGEVNWTLDDDGVPVALADAEGRLSLALDRDYVQKPQFNLWLRAMRLRKAYGRWQGTWRAQPGAAPVPLTLHGFGEEMRLKW